MRTSNRLTSTKVNKCVRIPADDVHLLADLQLPLNARVLVILAYDFGRSRNHPRCQCVARVLRDSGFGTLLCDLLTEEEEVDGETIDIHHTDAALLAKRLEAVTRWAAANPDTKRLRIAYFGIRTGGGAAMIAASRMRRKITAVVSRGGRLDLAGKSMSRVVCPTLLLVGGNDATGVKVNRQAFEELTDGKELRIVPGASELFGEPGKLEAMARMAAEWLQEHIVPRRASRSGGGRQAKDADDLGNRQRVMKRAVPGGNFDI